jgi:hypothetical protein
LPHAHWSSRLITESIRSLLSLEADIETSDYLRRSAHRSGADDSITQVDTAQLN